MPQSYKQFLAKSAKRRARVIALNAAGLTPTEIGKRLKMSRQRASAIIHKQAGKVK